MSVERTGTGWRVRWREAGRNRARVVGRKRDAQALDAELRRRRRLGELALVDAGTETLNTYVVGTWAEAHGASLAPKTRKTYAWAYDHWIAPRLGGLPLRDISPDVVAHFQADLIAAGAGPEAVRKSVTLLGGILQRAAESRAISANPARLVRRAPAPAREEVRPLAPVTVEAVRARLPRRDATVISAMAYSGLRPQEIRGLLWGQVLERTLVVNAPKTRTRRNVRLLAPLASDLREWRLASGRPGTETHVFPGEGGEKWTAEGFNKWRGRVFHRALEVAGVPPARPYDLRHSFASLLLHEGRSVIYVARQLGHGAELTMRTYGHVIEELEDAPHLSAEAAIRSARGELVPVAYPQGGRE